MGRSHSGCSHSSNRLCCLGQPPDIWTPRKRSGQLQRLGWGGTGNIFSPAAPSSSHCSPAPTWGLPTRCGSFRKHLLWCGPLPGAAGQPQPCRGPSRYKLLWCRCSVLGQGSRGSARQDSAVAPRALLFLGRTSFSTAQEYPSHR